MALLLILLICIPITEIICFILVGDSIGLSSTIAIIILSTVVGVTLLRFQGSSILLRVQSSLRLNVFPVEAVFDGLCIFVAGILLIIPGFITDTIGTLVFFPPSRLMFKTLILKYIKTCKPNFTPQSTHHITDDDNIINVDYLDITDNDNPLPLATDNIKDNNSL
jgi:UPF0716 protein FxsA